MTEKWKWPAPPSRRHDLTGCGRRGWAPGGAFRAAIARAGQRHLPERLERLEPLSSGFSGMEGRAVHETATGKCLRREIEAELFQLVLDDGALDGHEIIAG